MLNGLMINISVSERIAVNIELSNLNLSFQIEDVLRADTESAWW